MTGGPDAARRRVERVAGFGAELADLYRREFAALWSQPRLAAEIPEAADFMGRVEAWRELAGRYLAEAEATEGLPPDEATARLEGLDLNALHGIARGCEGVGAYLRDHPRLRGQVAGGGPAGGASGGSAGGSAGGPSGPAVVAIGPARSPGRAEPASTRGGADDLLAELGPRMALLRCAARGEPPAEDLPADLRAAWPGLRTALAASPAAMGLVRTALAQWEAAVRLPDAAGPLPDALRTRGAFAPLLNLPWAFRGVPALAALFPVPRARPAAAPAAPEPGLLGAAERARKRLSTIRGAVRTPDDYPRLADPHLFFRLVTEERDHQREQAAHFRLQLRMLPPAPPEGTADPHRARRKDLAWRLRTAEACLAEMDGLLVRIRTDNEA